MKILITGALGHIGSQLIRSLPTAYSGVQIIMLDNMITQRYASLFNLPSNGNYHFIENDVLETDQTKFNLNELINSVNYVIHLAALTDATKSFDQPEQMHNINFTITKRIAELCTKYHKPLFFPSSTSVYGPKTNDKPITIDDIEPRNYIQPQSPYAESKLREENLLLSLHREQGLPVVICRFGTIYGPSPGMRFHTAVNKFCWQAVLEQPISVWETAMQQLRPYLALEDATRIINYILTYNLFNGEIYNVITENHTVENVISKIQTLIPTAKVQLTKSKIMNDSSFIVRCEKLNKLGFEFVGNLSSGIQQTIALLQQSNLINFNRKNTEIMA